MKKFFVIFISLFVLFGCCSSNNTRPGATYNGSTQKQKSEYVMTTSTRGYTPRKVEGGGLTYLVGMTPDGYPIYRFDYDGKSFLIAGRDCIIEIQ